MRLGHLQVVEEELNTHGREILAGTSETMAHGACLANGFLSGAPLLTALDLNEAQAAP